MTATDVLSMPDAITLCAAIDAAESDRPCRHCGRILPEANLHSDRKAMTCYACHRDTHVETVEELVSVLADLLEEAGDPRAAGLRSPIRPAGNRKTAWNYGVSFVRASATHSDSCPEWLRSAVPDDTFDRLAGHVQVGNGGGNSSHDVRRYRLISAAYLALAEALIGASA